MSNWFDFNGDAAAAAAETPRPQAPAAQPKPHAHAAATGFFDFNADAQDAATEAKRETQGECDYIPEFRQHLRADLADRIEATERMLRENAVRVCQTLLPGGSYDAERAEYRAASINGGAGDSFVIDLDEGSTRFGIGTDATRPQSAAGLLDLWMKNRDGEGYEAVLDEIDGFFGGGSADPEPEAATESPAETRDEWQTEQEKRAADAFTFEDEMGRDWCVVYRHINADGTKTFRHYDVQNNRRQAPAQPWKLFNLKQVERHQQVVLTESIRAADALNQAGIVATATLRGAHAPLQHNDWSPLAGKAVVVWPDRDPNGWDYAERVARQAVQAGAVRVAIAVPQGVENKKLGWDAADALAEGEDPNLLLNRWPKKEIVADPAQRFSLLEWTADVYSGEVPKLRFTVARTFQRGKPYLVGGRGDIGKGGLTVDAAFNIAYAEQLRQMGRTPMAFGNDVEESGTVVMLLAEDDQVDVHNRLNAIDPTGIRFSDPKRLRIVPFPDAGGPPCLFRFNRATGMYEDAEDWTAIWSMLDQIDDLAMCIFDPITPMMAIDINADPQAGGYMTSRMAQMARRKNATVLLTHHMGKGDKTPIEDAEQARSMIRGTTALVDGLRGALALWPADEDYAQKVCDRLKTKYEPNKVVIGAMVKSNGPADRTPRTYVRDDNGILKAQPIDDGVPEPTMDEAKETIIEAIRQAAKSGRPFTYSGQNGITAQRRHELPKPLDGWNEKRLQGIVKDLMKEPVKRGGDKGGRPSKETILSTHALGKQQKPQWLDAHDGPIARGKITEYGQTAD